jgi:hypothetical protein
MAGPLDFAQMVQQLGLVGNAAYDPITNKNKGLNPLAGTEGARPYYGGSNGVRAYKGMHPYDAAGKEINTIRRDGEFPAFNRGEPGVKVGGGFYTSDPSVASRFAKGLSEYGGAVYPANIKFKNPYVIDAAGKPAGEIQFGPTGKPFRDAIRSKKYDGVVIKNTKDEGDVYVALGKGTAFSSTTGKKLFGVSGALGLGDILSGALDRKEPLPPL